MDEIKQMEIDEMNLRHKNARDEEKKKDLEELADGKAWEWWTDGSGKLYIQPSQFSAPCWIKIEAIIKSTWL